MKIFNKHSLLYGSLLLIAPLATAMEPHKPQTRPPTVLDYLSNITAAGERLLKAVRAGNIEEVREALRSNAPPSYSNFMGENGLHLAALDDKLEIIFVLIAWGADLNAQNFDGDTPLHYAGRFPRVVDHFLYLKADTNLVNKEGRNYLEYHKLMRAKL